MSRATSSINRKRGTATLEAAHKFMSQQLDKPEPADRQRAVEHLNRLMHESEQLPERKAVARA